MYLITIRFRTRHPYVNATFVLTKQSVLRFGTLAYQSDTIYALSPDGYSFRQALKIAHDFSGKVIRERKHHLAKSEGSTADIPKKDRLMPFIDILLKARVGIQL